MRIQDFFRKCGYNNLIKKEKPKHNTNKKQKQTGSVNISYSVSFSSLFQHRQFVFGSLTSFEADDSYNHVICVVQPRSKKIIHELNLRIFSSDISKIYLMTASLVDQV